MKQSGLSPINSESYKKLRQSAFVFSQQTAKFKKLEAQYEALRAKFGDEAGAYMAQAGGTEVLFEYDGYANGYEGTITVRRIQGTTIKFDPDKVEQALGKKLAQKVVQKRYELMYSADLIAYLRSCGVDPAKFAKYVNVEKTVNQAALERLEQLGAIDQDDLAGTFTVNKKKPYYTLSLGKGQGNE